MNSQLPAASPDSHRVRRPTSAKYLRLLPKCVISRISNVKPGAALGSRHAILFEKFKKCFLIQTPPASAERTATADKRNLLLISTFMRETMASVEKTVARNSIYLRDLTARCGERVDPAQISRHCDEIKIEQRTAYQNLLREDTRSRILVCYHFGDYVYGMNTFNCLESPGRERYVLSQKPANAVYFENLHNALGALAIDKSAELIRRETNSSDLSSLLRKGNCTLHLFCDVPVGFGERIEVKFLNRTASFSKGPATLAIANRTPLLPVINYSDGDRNRIILGTQIEPCLNCDESLQEGIRRITQEFIDFFEPFFKRYPEQ